jgi:hypothetical protein
MDAKIRIHSRLEGALSQGDLERADFKEEREPEDKGEPSKVVSPLRRGFMSEGEY